MFIKMTRTLPTAIAAFQAGESYDVTSEMGAAWIKAGIAVETGIPAEWIADLYARLDEGAGQPVLFCPFIGEFGHMVASHLRIVHFNKAAEKIVCCRPGEEVLYPSAADFVTNWTDPIQDATRAGTMRSPVSFWRDITARYPDHQPIESGNLSRSQEMIAINSDQRIPFRPKRRGLKADVLIGVRKRSFHEDKNYPHWQHVADALKAEGITYAVIGDRRTSDDLQGQEWHSGDYDTDAAIEGMQDCQLFISTDTGSAHLASTVGCRQLIFREEFFSRSFVDRMRKVNPQIEEVQGAWAEPQVVIDRALQLLQCRRESTAA